MKILFKKSLNDFKFHLSFLFFIIKNMFNFKIYILSYHPDKIELYIFINVMRLWNILYYIVTVTNEFSEECVYKDRN